MNTNNVSRFNGKEITASKLIEAKNTSAAYVDEPFRNEKLLLQLVTLLEKRIIQQDKANTVKDEPKGMFDIEHPFIQRLNEVITKLYKISYTTNEVIAEHMFMSERQFYRKLKSVVDMTPREYLKRFRLEKAKALLNGKISSKQIAAEVGFSSHSYFSSCFKAFYGVKPSEQNRVSKSRLSTKISLPNTCSDAPIDEVLEMLRPYLAANSLKY